MSVFKDVAKMFEQENPKDDTDKQENPKDDTVEQEEPVKDLLEDNSVGMNIIRFYNEKIPQLIEKLRGSGAKSDVIKPLKNFLYGSGKNNQSMVVTPSKKIVATITNSTTKEKQNIQGYKTQELDSLEARLISIGRFLNGDLDRVNKNVRAAYKTIEEELKINLDPYRLPPDLEKQVPKVLDYIKYARNNLTEKVIKENQRKIKEAALKAAEDARNEELAKANKAIEQERMDIYNKGRAAGDIAGQVKGFAKAKAKYERRRASDGEIPIPPPDYKPDASKQEIVAIDSSKDSEKKAQMSLNEYIEGIIQNDAFEIPEEKLREGIENAIKNKIVDIPKEQIETVIDKIYLDSLVYNQKLNEAATKLGYNKLPKAIQQRLKKLQRTDIENRKYKLFKKMVPKEPVDENARKISEFEDFYKHLNPLLLRGVVRLGRY